MSFSKDELRVAQFLKSHKDSAYSPSQLASEVFGTTASVYIQLVLKYLKNTTDDIQISHAQDGTKLYGLSYADELTSEQIRFQDWLALNDVGVIKRTKDVIYPDDGSNFYQTTEKIIEVLNEYFWYILPYTLLCDRVYGTQTEMKNLKQNISRIDKYYSQDFHPVIVKDHGYGIGLVRAPTSKLVLDILHLFWKSKGEAISREYIASSIWGYSGEMTEQVADNVRLAIRRSDCALSHGAYGLVKESTKNQINYRFHSRR